MNRRKILITAVCILLAASVIAAAACTTRQIHEKSVFERITELAATADNVELRVSSGGETLYSYNSATSAVSNPYGLDIDPAALIGQATGGVLLTRDKIEEGYSLTYDSVTGEAALSCVLTGTSGWLGVNADGAQARITANLLAGSLSSYSITYNSGGYTVTINLSI